jgi:CHAT domain-containing protein
LLEYFTHEDGVEVALVHPDLDAPVVVRAGIGPDGQRVTRSALDLCGRRLIIDFNGLSPGWDRGDAARVNEQALQLEPAVNSVRRLGPIRERTIANPSFRYATTYWQRLGAALIPDELRAFLEDRDLICVVPHGPLHGLPFAALAWDSETLVADRFGVVMVPSATVLKYCQQKNRARRGARPASAFVAAVGAAEDREPAELEDDGHLLQALLPTEECCGPDAASRKAVMAGMQQAELIHLACHGFFGRGTDPMSGSGLLVASGGRRPWLREAEPENLISAQDILGIDLSQAMLVTLRACSSGRTEVRGADELFGLARALLYAGTPSLLVGQWNVSKHSSRLLMEAFYNQWLGSREEKWKALRTAQLMLRESGRFEHPYHWAPFVLVGDWL